MLSFSKSLRHHQQVRRFSIAVTPSGWEVREERDREIVRSVHYQDWHRVERARKALPSNWPTCSARAGRKLEIDEVFGADYVVAWSVSINR